MYTVKLHEYANVMREENDEGQILQDVILFILPYKTSTIASYEACSNLCKKGLSLQQHMLTFNSLTVHMTVYILYPQQEVLQ